MIMNFIMSIRVFGTMSEWNPQSENYYKILRVAENSTHQQIRDAFMQLSKQYHPDAAIGSPLTDDRTEQFVKISEAYQTLSRPSLKKQYDQNLWMRSMSERTVKSGTYGFIHDFHCFGRRGAQQQFETNYAYMPMPPKPKTKPKPVEKAVVAYNMPKAIEPIPEPGPKLVEKMCNVLATHVVYTGICGAIFGVINARCGINHAKIQVGMSSALMRKRRLRMLGDLIAKGRQYIEYITKGGNANAETPVDKQKKPF